jgi:DNA mismatch repair protein MutS
MSIVDTVADAETASLAAPPDAARFQSILRPGGVADGSTVDPDYFHDLHLDEIVRSVTAGRDPYDLVPFFRERVTDVETVEYRQQVFRDLDRQPVISVVRSFAAGMREVGAHRDLAAKAYYGYERERWVLAAASTWCRTIRALLDGLDAEPIEAIGLHGVRAYLRGYTASQAFAQLAADAARVEEALAGIRYRLRLEMGKFTVSRAIDEPDFGAEVLATFERFKQGDGREYPFEYSVSPQLNHIEAAVTERVARLFPAVFGSLAAFHAAHADFTDPVILRFAREIQFYVAYLEHLAHLRRAGLEFSLPNVSGTATAFAATGLFDLALASHLVGERTPIVLNDIDVREPERIVVVTGPNQGGKTTFARAIGQMHHLAAIGCPVPGTKVRIGLVDGIHALFERQENVEDLASKLEEDLRRMRAILGRLTNRSLVIMNETFSSTTVGDQAFINREVLAAIDTAGAWCVTVTFLDELAALGPSVLSMVSNVDPENPARRTFRIVRRDADGLAYAMAVAEKHGLTYDQVRAELDA